MADLSVTAASVAAANAATNKVTGTAGATITAGQALYLDSTTDTLKLTDNDDTTATAAIVGVSLHGASSGQPITYATGGAVTFNAALTAGLIYCTSSTAGGIAPSADNATSDTIGIIGYASSTTNMVLQIKATGVTHG